ncbi:MAG: peptide-methionine (S)-S-oxide reductase MsrA [Bacteroidales bacterium]|nr:peptide-methionine (S)-S-oxide reductase MsrA [Bacteroidales bacterium]
MKNKINKIYLAMLLLFGLTAAASTPSASGGEEGLDTATFASGCFWCTEAIFSELNGVKNVISGYTGGHVKNPSYREVCNGTTGHAEAVQITYDPQKISYPDLLEVFFMTHNPTTLNRQGADVGTQYRSAIFYHNDKQKKEADEILKSLESSGIWSDPIVTELSPVQTFYTAEEDHQDYFLNNPNAAYCNFVIVPKIEKFRKVFAGKLKKQD